MLRGLRLEEIGQLLESFGFRVPQTGEGFEDILLSLLKEMELQPGTEKESDTREANINKNSMKNVQQLIALIGIPQAEGKILTVAGPSKGGLPEEQDQDSVRIQKGTDELAQRQIAQSKAMREIDIGLSEEVSEAGMKSQNPVVNRSAEAFFESPPPEESEIDTINSEIQKNKSIPVQSWKTDTPELSKNGGGVLPPNTQRATHKVEFPKDVSADSVEINSGDPLSGRKREEITSPLNTGTGVKIEKGEAIKPLSPKVSPERAVETKGRPERTKVLEKKLPGTELEVVAKAQKDQAKESPNAPKSPVNALDTLQENHPEDLETSTREISQMLKKHTPSTENKPADSPIGTVKDHKPDTRIDKMPLTADKAKVDESNPEEAPEAPQRVKEILSKHADKEVPLPTKHQDLEAGRIKKESMKPEFAPQVREREAWPQRSESEGEVQLMKAERREIPLQSQRQDVKQINLRIEDAFLRFRFQSETLSVDVRVKEMIERNLSYLDVQRLSKSLQSLGLSLEGLRINGTEFYPRGSKFGRREERRFNIGEDAVSDKKAPDSSADSSGLNLLL